MRKTMVNRPRGGPASDGCCAGLLMAARVDLSDDPPARGAQPVSDGAGPAAVSTAPAGSGAGAPMRPALAGRIGLYVAEEWDRLGGLVGHRHDPGRVLFGRLGVPALAVTGHHAVEP